MYYLNVKNGTAIGPGKLSSGAQRKKRRFHQQKSRVLDQLRHNVQRMYFEVTNCRPFSHHYAVALNNFYQRQEKLRRRLYRLTGVWDDRYSWIQDWIFAREEALVAKELKLMNHYQQATEEKKVEPVFEDHPRWVEDWDRQAEANQLIE